MAMPPIKIIIDHLCYEAKRIEYRPVRFSNSHVSLATIFRPAVPQTFLKILLGGPFVIILILHGPIKIKEWYRKIAKTTQMKEKAKTIKYDKRLMGALVLLN